MEDGKLSRGPMIAITVLRVLVGWHFLYEGIAKLTSPSWSAAGYLKQARGPFAGPVQVAGQPAEPARQCGPHHDVGADDRRRAADPRPVHAAREPRRRSGSSCCSTCANPPFVGYFYSLPSEGSYLIVNKNLVELGALVVILVTGSGRFAGLDRIVHGLVARRPRLTAAAGSPTR